MGATSIFQLSSPTQTYYEENNQMAAWGSVVLAASHSALSTLSYQIDTTSNVHSSFVENGQLNGQIPAYEATNSVALVQDLGTAFESTSATFAVGQYRTHVVDYTNQEQVAYHMSQYGDVFEATNGFLEDYESAYLESQSLDKQIQQASEAVSSNYSDLTSAAMRQVFGAMEVTLPSNNLKADPYVFLKEISTDGNGYADYLVDTGIDQQFQLDTVDAVPASFNQTNLAIASAIGLSAYGALFGQENYTQQAQTFVTEIYTNGLGTDAPGTSATHFTYNYHDSTSWGTIFNFFPDALLDLNTFPTSAVSMQCDWYNEQKTSVGIPFASSKVELDEENGMWEMWVAATCPGALQETIINDEWAFLMNGKNTAPFPDRFYVTPPNAGVFDTTRARPTLGTTFSLLAKNGFAVSW
ncbi:hypothetical protein P7C71_g5593, partial [Lecanoromycetidae sp. Uapishka_2]